MKAWQAGQRIMLALTGAGVAGLILAPSVSLRLFWGVVVPVLPLSFLISPSLWRAICPLATLNMASSGTGERRRSARISRWADAPALLMLVILVPARHVVFNRDATALALLISGAAVTAFLVGRRYEAKAGFCNTLCPILPVERLYGQRPLLVITNPRCTPCTMCTPRACIDLAGTKTLAQLIGPPRRSTRWLASSFGVFALAFPGFVAGYFTVDATTSTAWAVYRHVFALSLVSAVIAGTFIIVLRLPSRVGLALLAGLSAALYYWFALSSSMNLFGAVGGTTLVVARAAALTFIAWWTIRAVVADAGFASAA